MKIKLLTLATAAFISSSTLADSLDWNFVEAGYALTDIDGLSGFSPSGLAIAGSKLLDENIFIAASYSMLSDDFRGVDLDIDQVSAGIGYRYGLSSTTDVYVAASYEYFEVSANSGGGSADDSGYGLTIGVRSMLTEVFELSGSIGYVDIDDDSETALSVAAYYYFSDQVSIGAHHSTSSDADTTGVSVRYSF